MPKDSASPATTRPALVVDHWWIDNVPPKDSFYWVQIRDKATALGSDGCTFVSDIFLDACL